MHLARCPWQLILEFGLQRVMRIDSSTAKTISDIQISFGLRARV